MQRERTELQQVNSANFTLRMRYKGKDRAIKLPVTKHMICRLVLEAELRHMGIGELVSELIVRTMKKGVLQSVLDGKM
jgi:hypothetical protein